MDYRKTMARLSNALNQVNTSYSIIAKQYGLTYNTLMALYMIEEGEGITQKNICDALYLSKSTVHSMLGDLIKKGYVLLGEGDNKKEKYILFTPEGNTFFAQIRKTTDSFEREVLEFIGEEGTMQLLQQAERTAEFMLAKVNEVIEGE